MTSAEKTPDDTGLAPGVGDDPVWTDQEGRAWRLRLSPHELCLEADHQTLVIPSTAWSRDIYIAPHGRSYIVRIDTFDANVAFIVAAARAAPVIARLERVTAPQAAAPEPEVMATSPAPLLWPKVSPLAVWALICSSLVFVPVIGWLPAIATIVLLVLHRKKVRRARSWDHSRALCMAAFLFLACGTVVSVLGTLGMARHASNSHVARRMPSSVIPSDPGRELTAGSNAPAQGWLEAFEHINWGMLVAGLFVVVLSLTVHEAAHAITAWWLGDDLARQLGRVTLNPASHVDPIGTIVLPLLLYIAGMGVFGWAKPVPVRVEGLARRHRAHILISIAGPGSNLLLAAASLALMLGLGCAVSLLAPNATVSNFDSFAFSEPVTASGFLLASVFGPVCTVLKLSFLINVVLAVFNLIPIPPLDGSWVLEHLFPRTFGPIYARIRPFGILLFLFLIYSGTNILFYLLYPVMVATGWGFALLEACTAFV